MTNADAEFLNLLLAARESGDEITTRNSVCRRIIMPQFVFARTPLVTLRKTAWKNALREWEWFMSGSNNVNDLHESVRHWWRPWANGRGEVPYNYSKQFRDFAGNEELGGIDQIEWLIEGIREHPYSRRNVITTWHTKDMGREDCPITNCHGTGIQAFVDSRNNLSISTYQRSADVVCGLPHNWVQYWAFLLWLAHRTGRKPGIFIWVGGDVHVYKAHEELSAKIEREYERKRNEIRFDPNNPSWYPYWLDNAPELVYTPTSEEFKADDFTLDRPYEPLVTDKAEMIV